MTKPQSTAAYVLRLTLTLFLITVIVAGVQSRSTRPSSRHPSRPRAGCC